MSRQPSLLPGPWIRPHGEQLYEPPRALPYVDGSDTSEEAARRAMPRAGSDARRILALLRIHGPLCCREIEDLTGLEHETASARVTGLKRGGWIRDTGERRPSRKGNPMTVWEVVE